MDEKNPTAVSGTIARFEGMMAVISLEQGQQLMWPIQKLPVDCRVGQMITLIITTTESQQAERDSVAKNILNTIFKNTKAS